MSLSTCNFCDAEYDPYEDHTCKGNQILARKRPPAAGGFVVDGLTFLVGEKSCEFPGSGWGESTEARHMMEDISRVPLDFSPPNLSALDTQPGGDHYRKHAIQPVEYIVANGLDFLQGNIVKYATRHKDKGGAADVRKIIHYAQIILELQYKETK